MNNNNSNNNSNNYVTPEQVDLSKVNVGENNGALNRERDNIISATIQANDAINENQAKVVNNSIKIKKRNPIFTFLVGLIAIMLAGGGAYLGYKLMDDYLKNEENKHTTTTTTTESVNHVALYTSNRNKVRKYQNDDTILILTPKISGLVDTYIYLKKNNEGIISQETGTYNISDDKVELISNDSSVKNFNITREGLVTGDNILKMYDSEMKYYTFSNESMAELLVINATLNSEIAYYISTSGINNLFKYTENDTSISLENGVVFTKEGMNITNNGITLTLNN